MKTPFKIFTILLWVMVACSWQGNAQTCTASFNYSVGSGGTVSFFNTSAGTASTTSFFWSIPGGSPATSTLANPATSYSGSGTYTVQLTVMFSSPSCTATTTQTLFIAPPTCTASFNYSVGAGGTVNFFNTSSGTGSITSFLWLMPGGSPDSSTIANPVTNYTNSGIYTVQLIVVFAIPGCTATTTQTLFIAPTCTAAVSYTAASSSSLCNGSAQAVPPPNLCGFPTYTWSNGANSSSVTNLCPGIYTVYIGGSFSLSSCCPLVMAILNIPACSLTANFTYSQSTSGMVAFVNSSTGTNSGSKYFWDFGDNNTDTIQVSPVHNYSANGSYPVTLTVNNGPNCISTKTMMVNVTSYTCSANFIYSVGANGNVTFSSNSMPSNSLSTYYWNFGNGATYSATGSPTAVTNYTANGLKTVTLFFTTSTNCSSNTIDTFTVKTVSPAPCNLSVSFSHTAGVSGVTFSSTSSGTGTNTTYKWFFGDGTTGSGQPTFHTYTNGGSHLVKLVVTSGICKDSIIMSVNITGVGCTANSGFSLVKTATPKYWHAIPVYPYNVIAASWDWGDGNTSNTLYTSHQYSMSATYNICLSLTVSCGDTSSTCSPYLINRSSAPAEIYYVNVVDPSLKPLGLDNHTGNETTFELYPNPNSGMFKISMQGLQTTSATVRIYNVPGAIVYLQQLPVSDGGINEEISTDHLPEGLFFVEITDGSRQYHKRMILNR